MTFQASKLFGQLGQQELDVLTRIAREQTFQAGQEIFREGGPGDGLYFVRDGLVEISVKVGQDSQHVFSQVGEGDIFGEMAVLEDKPRSATATASKQTSVYFLPRAELLKLVAESPALALSLLRETSNRLREFNRQYLREVLQAERLAVVGRFARSIIHDLKNPLNIIGITAEMAGTDTASVEMRSQAKSRIGRQVERISEMINEILDFTQGSAATFVPTPIKYRDFVQQVVEEIRPEIGSRALVLELGGVSQETALLLNPKRIRRVFYNLIHNAAEAMPDGGTILVRVQSGPQEVVTEIEDTGPGIAPEIANRLFEPFATHGKAHGTGLGLSICKRILEEHGGWIKARNQPGRGAVFVFGLPVPK